jgi:hypothetical protein
MSSQFHHNNFSPVSPPIKRLNEPHSTFVASGWRDVNGLGTIRGAVNIYTRSGFVFNSVFLHVRENEDGSRLRWVQLAGLKQPDGTFRPLVEFSTPEARRSFNVACLSAIDELLRPGGAA